MATDRAWTLAAAGQGAGAARSSFSTLDSVAIFAPLPEAAALLAFGEARPAGDRQCLHLPYLAPTPPSLETQQQHLSPNDTCPRVSEVRMAGSICSCLKWRPHNAT